MPSLRTRRSLPSAPAKKELEDEEDVNAPPRGTSDEEGFSDSEDEQSDGLEMPTPRKPRTPRNGQTEKTLEQKLAENNDGRDFTTNPPGSSRKRKATSMLGSDDMAAQDPFDTWSSQRSKRPSLGYGSRFRKTPSSSMVESHAPSSAPQPKSSVTSFSTQADSPEEEKEEKGSGFRVPRNPEIEPPPSSFEIPESDDETSDLSSAKSYDSASFAIVDDSENVEPAEYLCPMCKEPVEPELLVKFRAQPRQRIRDQYVFCESHKKPAMEKEWEEKGYPTIDWERFDGRIEAHFDELEKLMVPESSSYYRNVLDTTMKSGKAKNFRLTLAGDALETISCGYYGTRGSGRM